MAKNKPKINVSNFAVGPDSLRPADVDEQVQVQVHEQVHEQVQVQVDEHEDVPVQRELLTKRIYPICKESVIDELTRYGKRHGRKLNSVVNEALERFVEEVIKK